MHPFGSWASRRKALARPLVWAVTGSLLFATAACGSGGESGADGGTGEANTKLSAAQQKCVDKADAFIKARGGLLPKSLPSELTPLKEAPPKGLRITQVQAGSIPTGIEHAKNLIKAAAAIGWTGKMVTYDGSVEDLNRKTLGAIDDSDIVFVDGKEHGSSAGADQGGEGEGCPARLGRPD